LNKQAKTFCCDVAILGGGPAGTATALSLRQHAPALSLALIEQSNYDTIRIGETLPPTAQPLLEQLGVWPIFLRAGHTPAYGSCAAWGSDKLWANEFIFHATGHGWHLDRKRFDALLAHEAASKGVALYADTKLIASRPARPKQWQLTLRTRNDDELSIAAAFVVDATGRRAVFASQQNVRKVLLDQLLGVCAFFNLNKRAPLTETYTLVEACAKGWWYSALVPEEKLAVCFMSDGDLVKQHRLHAATAWFELLAETRHTKARVQQAEPMAAPTVQAAYSQRLERLTGDAWLAVGDAATTFDPLSSTGICKGLRSGIMASYAIIDYFKGSTASLAKYEAITAGEFEAYLETRAAYYNQEQRWADALFWQRRHDQITLAPKQMLRLTQSARKLAGIEKLAMHLPAHDLKLLCQICDAPRQAQDVVAEFKARRSLIPDRRIILALQYLVSAGIIKAATV
jgi:flavin-dependent dehydrogenase